MNWTKIGSNLIHGRSEAYHARESGSLCEECRDGKDEAMWCICWRGGKRISYKVAAVLRGLIVAKENGGSGSVW